MSKRNTTTKAKVATRHAHRWRIDEPNGPTSMGLCGECGAVKEFQNWLSDTDYITNEEHRVARAA